MEIELALDMLNENRVSVVKKYYSTELGSKTLIKTVRVPYYNSAIGRAEVENELPEPQKNAIFAIWGTEPTIED